MGLAARREDKDSRASLQCKRFFTKRMRRGSGDQPPRQRMAGLRGSRFAIPRLPMPLPALPPAADRQIVPGRRGVAPANPDPDARQVHVRVLEIGLEAPEFPPLAMRARAPEHVAAAATPRVRNGAVPEVPVRDVAPGPAPWPEEAQGRDFLVDPPERNDHAEFIAQDDRMAPQVIVRDALGPVERHDDAAARDCQDRVAERCVNVRRTVVGDNGDGPDRTLPEGHDTFLAGDIPTYKCWLRYALLRMNMTSSRCP